MRKPRKGGQRPPLRGLGLWEDMWTAKGVPAPGCGWRTARAVAGTGAGAAMVENPRNLIGTPAQSC
jgi:hypothetical protein